MLVIGSVVGPGTVPCTMLIDGETFTSYNTSFSSANNNILLCSLDGNEIETTVTPSHLTVIASGTSDSPFLFDYIQYVPDASTILDNATVMVEAGDRQIQYSSGARPHPDLWRRGCEMV